MTGYELSRTWFNWCFENSDKIKPNHTALYFFCIEHCNRMGWVKNFGLPTEMAKSAIGINSYNTYSNTLQDLVSWQFITMIKKSSNQYSSNVVALSNFDRPIDKALDKASIKHVTKQVYSTCESIDSINKQLNNEPLTIDNNLRDIILSLNSEIKNLKNENEKRNQPFGEDKLSGTALLARSIKPKRPLSDFVGEISLEGKIIK